LDAPQPIRMISAIPNRLAFFLLSLLEYMMTVNPF